MHAIMLTLLSAPNNYNNYNIIIIIIIQCEATLL